MDKQAAEIGLYKAGIRGKMWLLDSAMNKQQRIRVRVNGRLTSAYSREGGAPQGAVLTPENFNGAKSTDKQA